MVDRTAPLQSLQIDGVEIAKITAHTAKTLREAIGQLNVDGYTLEPATMGYIHSLRFRSDWRPRKDDHPLVKGISLDMRVAQIMRVNPLFGEPEL